MRLQRESNGQVITLESGSILGVGGEARIYSVAQNPQLVAKVYHQPTDERARKLTVMLANPPDDPMTSRGHISIAWPVDLLHSLDSGNQTVGFLMPRMTGMNCIVEFYNPRTRRQHCPLFNYLYLHRTARNLAAAVRALHERGYTIGDVNESNIFVADTALVTLVDTDSFQVNDPRRGAVYRCIVGKPEFTPPELQGVAFADIDRSPEHDVFGLAVLIFQLLMEGTHPFAGVFQGEGDPPPYEKRISAGHFPYGRRWRMPCRPAITAPPFGVLHPALRKLFVRCFRHGRRRPGARPDAQAWQDALTEAENALVICSANDQHLYGDHLKTCPWCERSAQLNGRDPFPSQQSVESGQHLRLAKPTQKPLSPAGKTVLDLHIAPTEPMQPAITKHSIWAWTSLMLASLSGFILANGIFLLLWWTSLICVAFVVIWGILGWHWAEALTGRNRWLAVSVLGKIGAVLLALLLVPLLTVKSFPWWLLLAFGAILSSAALACGIVSWQRAEISGRYGKWLAGVALGMGTTAALSVLLFVAYLIKDGNLPWRLSLIFAPILGVIALACGAAGWRWTKALTASGKWLAGVILAIGTSILLLLLLVTLEAFMLVSNQAYLVALAYTVVLCPAALICGIAGWHRITNLIGHHDIWLVGASPALLVAFMIVCGQLYVALLVYTVLLVGTTALACAFDWQQVKRLVEQGRWKTGTFLGAGTTATALVLLLIALMLKGKL